MDRTEKRLMELIETLLKDPSLSTFTKQRIEILTKGWEKEDKEKK